MKKASSASINVDFEADPADPSQSLEERLGLRSDQLRELLEQELPVPREDLIARKDKTAEQPKEVDDPNKVFRLPDLVDFNKEAKDDNKQTARQQAIIDANKPRVDRGDSEEFMRLLQLNPFADADESLFLEEVSHSYLF